MHVPKMIVLPLWSRSSSPVWFLHYPSLSLDILNLQMKALQSFEIIYPVSKHDTPEGLNLLLMINLGKGHLISTGLEAA